jgi:TPP-dependent pyruvate/acetoin dehydrogenase alpha subunit
MADAGAYRPPVEVKAWQAIDPLTIGARELEFHYPTPAELAEVGPDNIARLTEHMISAGHLEEEEIAQIRKETEAVVEDAVQFSLASPQPTMDEAWRYLNCNRHQERLLQA